jgi:hypothetical protein
VEIRVGALPIGGGMERSDFKFEISDKTREEKKAQNYEKSEGAATGAFRLL